MKFIFGLVSSYSVSEYGSPIERIWINAKGIWKATSLWEFITSHLLRQKMWTMPLNQFMKYSTRQATVIIRDFNDLNISWKIFQLEVGGSTDLWSLPDNFIFQTIEKEARVSVFLDLILPNIEEVFGRLKMLSTLREGNGIMLQFKERSKRLRKLNHKYDHLQGKAKSVCEMTKRLSQSHNMSSASFVDVLWKCTI